MLAHFPYHHLGPLELGPLKVHPFGVLVGIAIVVGTIVADKRAKKLGLDGGHVSRLAMWAVIPGFIGAHLYAVLAYEGFDAVAKDPLILLRVWEHISSFGGFVGATLGILWYVRRHNLKFLVYAEAIVYAFAFAWIFGRLGCTVAYDHPGLLTDFALGMPYPYEMTVKDPTKFWLIPDVINTNVRHNLGFYECLWTIGIAGFFFSQRKKARPAGWFLLVFVVLYMPIRFLFDFLRVQDVQWLGLTPGQYVAIALFVLGVWLLRRVRHQSEILVPDGQVHVFADGTPAFTDAPPAKPKPSNAPPKKKRKKKR